LEKQFEKQYHILEKTHWWFLARRNMIKRVLEKYRKDISILEVGCSSGHLMREITKAGYQNIASIDISPDAVKMSRYNNCHHILQMDGSFLGFKKNTFDVIIASAILEHIENDIQTIQEWKRALKDHGDLIIFVPAFPILWSDHDILNKHFRRYRKKELLTLLRNNDFQIIRTSYWNFMLFSPLFVYRCFKKILPRKTEPRGDLNKMNTALNFLFYRLLIAENAYCERFNFPWGVSLFVIARK
jgi:SAM-dependent methyltransferase